MNENQPEMVTLPNGIKIPKTQYEQEAVNKKEEQHISMQNINNSRTKGKFTSSEKQKSERRYERLYKG